MLNSQGHGHKTEPHYENLTENWCNSCMPMRIKSANRRNAPYLFLTTRYFRENHPRNGKLLVVGFLYRAEDNVWRRLSRTTPPSGAVGFNAENPSECGFFAGDESKSHFVSAENAFVLEGVKNGRWKWLAQREEADRIVKHLRKSPNILWKLRKKVHKLDLHANEKSGNKNRCEGC